MNVTITFLCTLVGQVNNTMISVFQRKRPRGDWMNVKMTGMAGESPVGFIKGEIFRTGLGSKNAFLRLIFL